MLSRPKLTRRHLMLDIGMLGIGGSALLAAPTLCLAGTRRVPLFQIERSKNANIVVYELILPGGSPPASNSVDVFWLLRAEDGRREELSYVERTFAYGYEVIGRVAPGGFDLRLVAVERLLRVCVAGDRAWAEVAIGKHASRLERVYVQSSGGGFWPNVDYIDLRGRKLADGTPVRERIPA